MKILSIIVPCYNSQNYMHNCINSLLLGGEDVEILIINDGSSDYTAKIANKYAEKHPNIVKVYHQKNAGHGGALNTGIKHASGSYIKVVDSDDWVDASAYRAVLKTLSNFEESRQPDMLITNFVYEKDGKKHKKIMRYTSVLPVEKLFGWNEVKRFRKGKYLLMHAIIYRSALLQNCGLVLPKHTFYVDNLYAYIPMRDVHSMMYLDVNFYRYYIGREGQSVQEDIMLKRIDQQLLVNRTMVTALDITKLKSRRHREYMYNYLEIVTIVSSVLLLRSNTKENYIKKRNLWRFIKSHNKRLYRKLRLGVLGQIINLPGATGRGISLSVYKIAQKVVGFN